MIVVTIILGIGAFWMTVRRERKYVDHGVVPEYRPVTFSKPIGGLGLSLIIEGALVAVVAAVTYGITRLVR
jgi:hypothetical protein